MNKITIQNETNEESLLLAVAYGYEFIGTSINFIRPGITDRYSGISQTPKRLKRHKGNDILISIL